MKKIMIDLDETIVSGGYLEALNEYLHTNYRPKDVKEYYVSNILTPEENSKYLDYFYQNINVYEKSHLIPDAIEVIQELNKYYDIYICSAFIDKRKPLACSIQAKYKYEWILKNMPYIDPKKIILTSSKDLIMCDVKIDDKVSNLKDGYGKIKLLLNQKHNESYSNEELAQYGILRVKNWREIYKLLIEGESPQ
ncbi:MAG: hypothetical protein HFH86_00215 [Bacilli bacterium]|nr:hypothetical protein [Bacilli bacterium]